MAVRGIPDRCNDMVHCDIRPVTGFGKETASSVGGVSNMVSSAEEDVCFTQAFLLFPELHGVGVQVALGKASILILVTLRIS